MWDEGYGAGMTGCGWVATVMGRFLKPHERAELAAGWKTGLRDLAAWKVDMETQGELEAAVALDEIPL